MKHHPGAGFADSQKQPTEDFDHAGACLYERLTKLRESEFRNAIIEAVRAVLSFSTEGAESLEAIGKNVRTLEGVLSNHTQEAVAAKIGTSRVAARKRMIRMGTKVDRRIQEARQDAEAVFTNQQ
jgi:hypothetical protein